jgi:putative salt-induced outer membrane protein YdiY
MLLFLRRPSAQKKRRLEMNRRLPALFIFSLLLVLAVFTFAQEKAEEVPHWKGDVSLGLSLARGNARSSNFSFTFSADGPVGRKLTWENKGIYLFGEMDGETSAESALAASRLDWEHTGRFFSYFELQGIRDRFKNYSSRFIPAVGVGYKVVDQKALSMVLDAGLSEVFTKYYDTGDTASYTGLKGGEGLVWKISETAEFNEKVELNSDISDLSHYFLRLEANLLTAIVKSWSVKLTFIDSFDNQPVGLGIKKNDITLIAGLSRKF